jgi:hypothetical protein
VITIFGRSVRQLQLPAGIDDDHPMTAWNLLA